MKERGKQLGRERDKEGIKAEREIGGRLRERNRWKIDREREREREPS